MESCDRMDADNNMKTANNQRKLSLQSHDRVFEFCSAADLPISQSGE